MKIKAIFLAELKTKKLGRYFLSGNAELIKNIFDPYQPVLQHTTTSLKKKILVSILGRMSTNGTNVFTYCEHGIYLTKFIYHRPFYIR